MAQQTKAQKAIIADKNRERDREDSAPPQARIEKKGYGGMETRNKGTQDKKGI